MRLDDFVEKMRHILKDLMISGPGGYTGPFNGPHPVEGEGFNTQLVPTPMYLVSVIVFTCVDRET